MTVWSHSPRILHSLKTPRADRIGIVLRLYASTKPAPTQLRAGLLDNLLHWTRVYLSLAKFRLSLLVVSTAATGYVIAPSPVGAGLLWVAAGTALCAGSANAFNQLFERSYDSQMKRTSHRVLVQGIISPMHACCFAITTAALGSSILLFALNELTASLGLFNILLYAFVYTPMKRLSVYNAWVGSVVGAIPPLMGWVAAVGTINLQAGVLSAILFAWQFPHIASLSWYTRNDYSRARYLMMSLKEPEMNFRVGLRYSLLMLPICCAAPLLGVTTYWFAVDSLLPNALLAWSGWRFYRERSNDSARKLFRVTLLHLPLIMMLMIINKNEFLQHAEQQTNNAGVETSLIFTKKELDNFV